MHRFSLWAIALTLLAGCHTAASKPEAGYYGLGQNLSPAEWAPWDLDVAPDGTGLPPGSGQANQGESLYMERCAQCHGEFGEGVFPYGSLIGGIGSLGTTAPVRSVGSFWPYTTTLFDYIRRTMPFDAPQSLSPNETYAVTAYVLYLNDLVPIDQPLGPKNLAQIEMPNRRGFVPDPRPDTHNRACMAPCTQEIP
ncbi:MAG: c-type cytochrome [bacterium]|nr:c-type cytochrome [bacterium]